MGGDGDVLEEDKENRRSDFGLNLEGTFPSDMLIM
jgi:hypothetical protein